MRAIVLSDEQLAVLDDAVREAIDSRDYQEECASAGSEEEAAAKAASRGFADLLTALETAVLDDEECAVICGLVQDSEDVNLTGIYSTRWEKLRERFPLAQFRKVAAERGEDFYDEGAGT